MKKFYCLYNRNNLPFLWKLKQANEKPLANFKSREDCLNYYLSFNNVGIIWFQKASTKATKKENLKDSFDGYIKSEMKDGALVHTIGVVPGTKENTSRILKRNLFHSLQIDPETGRDLLDEKGIDRLYNNKNSYLIFDNDVAEEISTVYDAKPIKIEKEETQTDDDDTYPIDPQHSETYGPQVIRNIVRNSPSNIKDEKVNQKDIVLDIDVAYNDTNNKKNENTNSIDNIDNESINNTGNQQINFTRTQPYGFVNDYNFNQSYNYQNYEMMNRGNFGVNINDFNFKNDFGNYKFKFKAPTSKYFLTNNFENNINNNGKILRNNFHNFYGNKGVEMNSNNNRFNTTNFNNGSNDVWVPVGQQNNNQNIQKPYNNGTVEFTAVPNQMLNTELNPLGANTMIFNPYTMGGPSYNNAHSNVTETLIQPIIQPVIQQSHEQNSRVASRTTILDPIVNEPIIADENSAFDPYYYAQYATSNLNLLNNQNRTSEFAFKNDMSNTRERSFTDKPRNASAMQQQRMTRNTSIQKEQKQVPRTIERPLNNTKFNNTKSRELSNTNDTEVIKKPKNRKLFYSIMSIVLVLMIIAIIIAILVVTDVIIIN
ncbi:MAG: hypothetical protein ACRCWU_01095 [Metamycoplasmataceae bacterium]